MKSAVFLKRCKSVVLLLVAVFLWPQHASAQNAGAQPDILNEVGIDQRLDEQIPLDLTFLDERGNEVQLQQYFGKKPVVLSLVYYECPMLCTLILNGVLRSVRALSFDVGDQFQIVTVSFDPSDTPALAKQKKEGYLKQYGRDGADKGWHFLTGDSASIRRLTEAVGFRYKYDPQTEQFAHASGIMVVTPQGKLARYFYGVEYSPRDLRMGLIDASAGQIGSPVDQVLLYCYHYDPTTGKYGLVIMRVMRIAGIATVLMLGSFMLVMFKRDRKNANSETEKNLEIEQ